jgi:NADPH-dependent ferric siderophore reductase
VARLRRRGRVAALPPLHDLDTPEDAAALIADPTLPPAIRAVLEQMGARW